MPHVRRRMRISLHASPSTIRGHATEVLGFVPDGTTEVPADGVAPLCGPPPGRDDAIVVLCLTCEYGSDVTTGAGPGANSDVTIEARSNLRVPYFGWFVDLIAWFSARGALEDAATRFARRGRRDRSPRTVGPALLAAPADRVHRGAGEPARQPGGGRGHRQLLWCAAHPELRRRDECLPQVRPGPRPRARDRAGRRARLPGGEPARGPARPAAADPRVARRCVRRERRVRAGTELRDLHRVAAVHPRVRQRHPRGRGRGGDRGGTRGRARLCDVDVRAGLWRRRRRLRGAAPARRHRERRLARCLRTQRARDLPRPGPRAPAARDPPVHDARGAHRAAREHPRALRPHLRPAVPAARAGRVPRQLLLRAVVTADEPLPAPDPRLLQLVGRRLPGRDRGQRRACSASSWRDGSRRRAGAAP